MELDPEMAQTLMDQARGWDLQDRVATFTSRYPELCIVGNQHPVPLTCISRTFPMFFSSHARPPPLLPQRDSGKQLLLITNSDYEYTNKMMSFAYDRLDREI